MSDIYQEVQKLKDQVERMGSWESRGQFKGCKATHDANQVWGATGNWERISLNTELWDYGAPFVNGMHWSDLACAGTVTKGIGGFTLVGVGTTFTTELAVGALVIVGTEMNVVMAITDNLNLSVQFAWGAAAAGSAYSRSNTGFVIPAKGVYQVEYGAQLSINTQYLAIFRNQMTNPAAVNNNTEVICGATYYIHCACHFLANKFDFVTFHVYANNAVTLPSRYDAGELSPASPMCSIVRIS